MNVEKIFASFGLRWSAGALALCLLASTSMAAQTATFAVLQQPAFPTATRRSPARANPSNTARAALAVGERGIVLLSDDSGMTWRQARVPVSVSLTAVQFVDAEQGWAVGHLGVVLHTEDGGETWHKQLDGERACLLYTSPSPRDLSTSRMPSSA